MTEKVLIEQWTNKHTCTFHQNINKILRVPRCQFIILIFCDDRKIEHIYYIRLSYRIAFPKRKNVRMSVLPGERSYVQLFVLIIHQLLRYYWITYYSRTYHSFDRVDGTGNSMNGSRAPCLKRGVVGTVFLRSCY